MSAQPTAAVAEDELDDPRLLAAVDEYLKAVERGERPTRKAWAARYPELGRALEDCLDGLDLVQSAAPKSKVVAIPDSVAAQPIGDYRLLREIGRGGMGVVYEAEQLSLGRRVAVKVLPFAAALDAKHLQRFRNEAQAAAHLHHSNIVPVYAVGCERGVHFYAMQLIDGRTLSSVIRELRALEGRRDVKTWPSDAGIPSPNFAPVAEDPQQPSDATTSSMASNRLNRSREFFRTAARLALQAAQALEHAHQMGVVHRDVKPGNLLIDHRGHLWVTDFGLARLPFDVSLTMTGDMLGTLRYMSPEQALGKRMIVDHRTDVYSLGATLYEMITLEYAVPGVDRQEVLQSLANDEPIPPRQHDKHIPVELETIVLKALSKLPSERYSTCADFADDLERFLSDRPILARPPTMIDRLAKWARRHRTFVGASAVFIVLLTAGLGVSTAIIAREHMKTAAALESEKKHAKAAAEATTSAESRFQQARKVVDLLTQVGEEELADSPRNRELRRKILETALGYYEEFLRERGDEPELQADLEAARQRVSRVLAELSLLQSGMRKISQSWLLSRPDVQEELQLSEATRTALRDARRFDMSFRDFIQLSPEERRAKFENHGRKHEETINALITTAQKERLAQIALQEQSFDAFRDIEVMEELKLTKPQRDRVKAHVDDAFFARMQYHRSGRSHEDEERYSAFKNQTMERILAILTPEQREKWKSMNGPPFERFGGVNRRREPSPPSGG
jgi:eukaryotic-like serine/threonine-protein kinase